MFYKKDINETFAILNTSGIGLNEKKAKEVLTKNGKNELPKVKEKSILMTILSQFKNPIELILVITVILSFVASEIIDAIALIIIIAVDVIIGTIEEVRAKKMPKVYLIWLK